MAFSYRNYEKEAHDLVQVVLNSSLERFQLENKEVTETEERSEWPSGASITPEDGLQAIQDYVKGWRVADSWRWCVDYLGEKDQLLTYRVLWSEPTQKKPVPVATASVYFYLLPCGKPDPVMVLYVIEGQRLVHRPGRPQFQEVWLRNVIENKLAATQGISL